jgi:hypothetical protein
LVYTASPQGVPLGGEGTVYGPALALADSAATVYRTPPLAVRSSSSTFQRSLEWAARLEKCALASAKAEASAALPVGLGPLAQSESNSGSARRMEKEGRGADEGMGEGEVSKRSVTRAMRRSVLSSGSRRVLDGALIAAASTDGSQREHRGRIR